MKISRTIAVLLGAVVLVGGANLAVYAATGGNFILGHINYESKASVLKNNGVGPALNLKANGAPLAVSNSKKVKRLNADKVDGRNAAALTTKTYVYETKGIGSGTTTLYVDFPDLPDGTYLVSYRVPVYFTGAADHALACYFYTSEPVLGTYGAGNGSGHSVCAVTGVIDTSTFGTHPFTVYSTNSYSQGTGPAQWTFTRINTAVTPTAGPNLTGP